jgi:hypothetical protein
MFNQQIAEIPQGIILVVEGNSDVRVLRGFAERALGEQSADFSPDLLTWRGLDEQSSSLYWDDTDKEAKARRIAPILGYFNGLPAKTYATRARIALTLCHRANPLAVVLVCDADHQPERLAGLQQARESHFSKKYPIAVAVANPCREAWVLAGFEPQNQQEQQALAALHKELDFNPAQMPERLREKKQSGDARNAKRVLEALGLGELERERLCWLVTAYDQLQKNGNKCGLTGYLNEVRQYIPPLLGL